MNVQNLDNGLQGIVNLDWEDLIATYRFTIPDIFSSDITNRMYGYLNNFSWSEGSLSQFFRADAPNTLSSFRNNTTNVSSILNEYPSKFISLRPIKTNVLSSDLYRFNLFHSLDYSLFNPWTNSIHSFLSLIGPYKIPFTGIITVSIYFWISNYLVPCINKIVHYFMNLFTKFWTNFKRYIRYRPGSERGSNVPEGYFWWISRYSALTGTHVIYWDEEDVPQEEDDQDPNDPRRPDNPFYDSVTNYITAEEFIQIREAVDDILDQVRNHRAWNDPNTILNTAPDLYRRLLPVVNIINRLPASSNSTGAYAFVRILLKWLVRVLKGVVDFLNATHLDNMRFGQYVAPRGSLLPPYEDEMIDLEHPDYIVEIDDVLNQPQDYTHVYLYDVLNNNNPHRPIIYNNVYMYRRLCWISQLLSYCQLWDPRL